MEPITCHVYEINQGTHLYRLPYTGAEWSESLNEPGSMSVTIEYSEVMRRLDPRAMLRPWRCLLALKRGGTVIHAGPLTGMEWNASDRTLKLDAGGGLTLLTKRLVLSRALNAGWRDRGILVDEKHPAGGLALDLSGTLPDLMRGLVVEALAWGPLPIDVGQPSGGGRESRVYYAWDLATVADRITELAEAGCEFRFDPHEEDGRLSFRLVAAAPHFSVPVVRKWNTAVPGQRIMLESVTGKGDRMTSQVWASGGKNDDRAFLCRRTTDSLAGWPLMQTTDTSRTTAGSLREIQTTAAVALGRGAFPDETWTIKVGEEHAVTVGDSVDLLVDDDFLGHGSWPLKVTDVSGSTDSDWLTVTAKERDDS